MVRQHSSNDINPEPERGPSLSQRLSRHLFERRRALQLTQAQVAERLGVDVETLSRFERGKHLPSLATLERLAGVLKTTVADLLSEQAPVTSTDEAETLALWLADLAPDDRAFARAVLKQCCDHLARKTMRRDPLRAAQAGQAASPEAGTTERGTSSRRRVHRSDPGAGDGSTEP